MTLPNFLTSFRVLLAPLLLWILTNEDFFTNQGFHSSWVAYFAGLIFLIASVTDFFDGFIAREWNQSSHLGAILDPLADKMLVTGAFLAFLVTDTASIWAIYLILIRELFISGLRINAVAEGIDISASWSGKVKTVVQMFSIGFLIMGWQFGEELLWIAVGLTLYSGGEYVLEYIKKVR
ncbi:CDP-diacylglycerol--glycerol-3-phosphate 3-phosphatidyltransferase [Thiovulum sp. ES]|nr:CDP-diacylglycerol--glycerol-3-phosphate 3-phosphatidyltransferase [Thiovulum sp. ES]